MSHTRLEQLVLAIGSASILGSLAVSLPAGSQPELIEILAQFLLLGVLFAAVRYGRKGGGIAACVAAIAYVVLRLPDLVDVPPTAGLLTVLAARIAAFGLVGIVGGEASRHILYSIAKLEGGSALDEWSRVFNERYFAKELEQALGRFSRYGEPFTIVVLTLSGSLLADLRPAKQRSMIRALSDNLRADVRMVDEVARLDDGRFTVMLPHTPHAGGRIVSTRLAELARTTLAARDEAVSARFMSVPEDEAELRGMLETLHARTDSGQSTSSE